MAAHCRQAIHSTPPLPVGDRRQTFAVDSNFEHQPETPERGNSCGRIGGSPGAQYLRWTGGIRRGIRRRIAARIRFQR